MHTDANQHVNSLVYPRVFEDAVVRRLLTQPQIGIAEPQTLLSRALEIRYRKPFFASNRARIGMSLEPGPAGVLAVGSFTPADAPEETQPSATLAMWLT
jgi:hypothetical protein